MRSINLNVKRYLQEVGECSIAAAASVANFFDSKVNYDIARSLINPDGEGLYTPEIAILLNKLGFKRVTVITADLDQIDYEWRKLKKLELIRQLKKMRRYGPEESYREAAGSYVQFLSDEDNDNNVIIDHHFGKYIREHLMEKKPVMASFNFTLFHGLPKWDDNGDDDPIRGESSQHEVVISGCDNDGVEIVDSHHELYHGRLSKFRSGRYRMDWETLHTVMGEGDIIIPDCYEPSVINELVSE